MTPLSIEAGDMDPAEIASPEGHIKFWLPQAESIMITQIIATRTIGRAPAGTWIMLPTPLTPSSRALNRLKRLGVSSVEITARVNNHDHHRGFSINALLSSKPTV